MLESGGFLTQGEIPKAREVLNAAALTYVAAAAMAALQLLRLLVLRGARDD
jgi:Zn-dependent membrane protease YugP